MRLKHNKKRNTAFIYEVLIKELSKASMKNLHKKKEKIIFILKEFFSKCAPLRQELDIHQSFDDLSNIQEPMVRKIILEARKQYKDLDKNNLDREKSRVINIINKEFGQDSWNTFVRDYKKLATVEQAFFSTTNPKKQVFLEEKLIKMLTFPKEENKQFPTVNNLALKTFLEKFNKGYGSVLNENQKTLLNKYITSYEDNGSELKIYLYSELDRLKEGLKKQSENNPDINLILNKIQHYSSKKFDRKMLQEIIKIQALVEEMTNADNT
jgi:hypothetical protein